MKRVYTNSNNKHEIIDIASGTFIDKLGNTGLTLELDIGINIALDNTPKN